MILFYGTKEQAEGFTFDSYATTAIKKPIGGLDLVYTDDKEIASMYRGINVEVKSITKPKPTRSKKNTEK